MLNETQKNMIRAVINDELDEIVSSLPENPSREDIILRMTALGCLTSPTPKSEIQVYEDKNIWPEIIRKIYEHGYPQNRCESYPYFGKPSSSNWVLFKDKNGKPAFEPMGLLGLSARNDDTALPVQSWDVIRYIETLIAERIDLLNEKRKKLPRENNKSLNNAEQKQEKLIDYSQFLICQRFEDRSGTAKGHKQVEFKFG